MVIHKCDMCGKEIGVWLNVKVSIGSKYSETNIANLLKYQGECQVCEGCFSKLYLKNEVE